MALQTNDQFIAWSLSVNSYWAGKIYFSVFSNHCNDVAEKKMFLLYEILKLCIIVLNDHAGIYVPAWLLYIQFHTIKISKIFFKCS